MRCELTVTEQINASVTITNNNEKTIEYQVLVQDYEGMRLEPSQVVGKIPKVSCNEYLCLCCRESPKQSILKDK